MGQGQGQVVEPDIWARMDTPDVYFSKAYHDTSSIAEPDVARSVLLQWMDDSGTVRLPLIIRSVAGGQFSDATSAYGYGGPWIEGEPEVASFRRFLDRWATDNGIVASFIRFHPLLDNAEPFSEVFPIDRIGQTASWDLANPVELVDRMAKNHRKSWRRAGRNGIEARITERPDDVDRFRQLYEESMGRLSARDFYWFSDDYWTSLRNHLRDQSLLVEAVCEGRVVASVWCLYGRDYLHFHLSGTTDEGRQLGGSFVCRLAAAQWARDRGLSLAHFGGGAGGANSPLLEWKRRFDESSPLRNFYVSRVVHMGEVFDELSGDVSSKVFFPPWRKPMSQ